MSRPQSHIVPIITMIMMVTTVTMVTVITMVAMVTMVFMVTIIAMVSVVTVVTMVTKDFFAPVAVQVLILYVGVRWHRTIFLNTDSRTKGLVRPIKLFYLLSIY